MGSGFALAGGSSDGRRQPVTMLRPSFTVRGGCRVFPLLGLCRVFGASAPASGAHPVGSPHRPRSAGARVPFRYYSTPVSRLFPILPVFGLILRNLFC